MKLAGHAGLALALLWTISCGHSDQNVQAPQTVPPPPPLVAQPAVAVAADAEESLKPATTCDDVIAVARKEEIEAMNRAVEEQYEQYLSTRANGYCRRRRHMVDDEAVQERSNRGAPPSAAGAPMPTSVPKSASADVATKKEVKADKAKSHSGTNNQVEGVDEADIVKTDGQYIYVAMNGALRILTALPPSTSKELSITRIGGVAKELFVDGNRAVVYMADRDGGSACTYAYDCQFRADGSHTSVLVFDLSDKAHPRQVRKIELSGSLMSARRIGNMIHTVVVDDNSNRAPVWTTYPDFNPCDQSVSVSDMRERFEELRARNILAIQRQNFLGNQPRVVDNGKALTDNQCKQMLRSPTDSQSSYTSIVSFDETKDSGTIGVKTIVSDPGAIYASTDSLYVATVQERSHSRRWYAHASSNEVTNVHKFRLGNKAEDTVYVGSGLVAGHVLNQFAMDERDGYLRMATSLGRVPDPSVTSSITVLAQNAGRLEVVGAINGIAPQEDIRSVRFDDDRGYIVTFKKTDPLFVFDLANPRAPKMLGELKIPGFSTYMHRLDKDHLLTIGFDANDHGDFAYFDGMILQIFDVTHPTDPKLLHKEKLGTRGTSSEAATNHLAFNYFADKKLLAFPMTLCSGGGDGTYGNKVDFSGLLVYRVDAKEGFKRVGGVSHGDGNVSCGNWWASASSLVKRSIFMDDYVYSLAPSLLKIQDVRSMGIDLASVRIDD